MGSPLFRPLTTYSWEQSDGLVKIYVPLRGVQTNLLRSVSLHNHVSSYVPLCGVQTNLLRLVRLHLSSYVLICLTSPCHANQPAQIRPSSYVFICHASLWHANRPAQVTPSSNGICHHHVAPSYYHMSSYVPFCGVQTNPLKSVVFMCHISVSLCAFQLVSHGSPICSG